MTVTFSQTAEPLSPPLLAEDEPLPYTVLNPDGKAKCLILCDHASNYVPKKLDNLGLSEEELQGHMAWDIGVGAISRQLSDILDAPAILANYSRLVIDLNRRLDHPTSIVTNSEGKAIPVNAAMAEDDRNLRASEIYAPYHKKVEELVDGFLNRDIVPAIISIHSFTRTFYKQIRPWEIGVLWVQDPRLSVPTIKFFEEKGYTVGDNEPYDARILRGTTVNHHADARGLPNALIEVRNDLVATEEGQREWAALLGECYKSVLQDETIYSLYDGPQVDHDPEKEYRYFDELIEKAKKGD